MMTDMLSFTEENVAGLIYVPELENPITRKVAKDGFRYFAADGSAVTGADDLLRIAALAIPPAYTDVQISSNPDAHLQATGRDARGRKQYRYHPRWSEHRGETKFAQLLSFASALPRIREKVDRDMALRKPSLEKAIATVVWLLDNLYIRVGNETYAQANGSFGLTTLRNRHVKLEGTEVRFQFKGKSGKEWRLSHRDRRIANTIRKLQELPGQQLFQYLDANGMRHAVRSQDVNQYIRDASGGNFSSRQFRTWGATHMAAVNLSQSEPGRSESQIKRQINAAVDLVAGNLMNTRAVCRSSYIHPLVIEKFRAGELANLRKIRTTSTKALQWMDADEIKVMKWLKANS